MDAPPAAQQNISTAEGAKAGYATITAHTIGRHHQTAGLIMAVLVVLLLVFIVLWVMYLNKYKDCEKSSKGSMTSNFATGGNNPLWWNSFGDAGWGGPMHSSHQPGETRVHGSSAEGGHTPTLAMTPSQTCGGAPSVAASHEASALAQAQALGTDGSAKNMGDDALVRVMNGGSVY